MKNSKLALQQIDEALTPLRELQVERPGSGWIAAIRTALSMSTYQLAGRIGISQPTLAKMEKREATGAITLGSLQKAADAMECDVFYALVPRQPLIDTLQAQALQVARREIETVAHSMQLERQGISKKSRDEQTVELAEQLVNRRRRALWS